MEQHSGGRTEAGGAVSTRLAGIRGDLSSAGGGRARQPPGGDLRRGGPDATGKRWRLKWLRTAGGGIERRASRGAGTAGRQTSPLRGAMANRQLAPPLAHRHRRDGEQPAHRQHQGDQREKEPLQPGV